MTICAEKLRLERRASFFERDVLPDILASRNFNLVLYLCDVRRTHRIFNARPRHETGCHIFSIRVIAFRLRDQTILARRQTFYAVRAVRQTGITGDDLSGLHLFSPDVRARGRCARSIAHLAYNRAEAFWRAVKSAHTRPVIIRERSG